jgi:hypothetical protein
VEVAQSHPADADPAESDAAHAATAVEAGAGEPKVDASEEVAEVEPGRMEGVSSEPPTSGTSDVGELFDRFRGKGIGLVGNHRDEVEKTDPEVRPTGGP